MLTASRFERLNGHVPHVVNERGIYTAACICGCGTRDVTLRGSGRSETKALECLLVAVLAEHGNIVIREANYQCSQCESIRGLSAHHVEFRSHGRDDRTPNLESLCLACHQRAHGIKTA